MEESINAGKMKEKYNKLITRNCGLKAQSEKKGISMIQKSSFIFSRGKGE